MHYWQDWTHLFDSPQTADLATGTAVQLVTTIAAIGVAVLVRRDPAA